MTPSGESSSRNDRAVILARGLGSRMGGPKGLLKFRAGGRTFVRIIADMYLERGMPVDIVVAVGQADAHGDELPLQGKGRVLAADPGGDTALTLLESWRSRRDDQAVCSHFWAHPVDLPLVTRETIALLEEASYRQPGRIIRPVREGIPGHPVILPYDVLAELDRRSAFHQGPLRDFLHRGGQEKWLLPPVELEVEDEGIDRDFDRPGDFDAAPIPREKEDPQ